MCHNIWLYCFVKYTYHCLKLLSLCLFIIFYPDQNISCMRTGTLSILLEIVSSGPGHTGKTQSHLLTEQAHWPLGETGLCYQV